MPELPEVETVKRTLEKNYLNRTIEQLDLHDIKAIHTRSEELFKF